MKRRGFIKNLFAGIGAGIGSWLLANRFEGATWSSDRSYLPGAVQSARFDVSCGTRTELVRRSRYFEKNNSIVNRLADLFECYTAGAGMQLHPSSSDAAWNKKAKASWETWTQFADLTSRASFGTLMSLAARTWFIDGEVFIVLTRGESGRPRLQLIEGHLCQTPPELKEQEGVTITDGIAHDRNGRPQAYYFATEDKNGNKTFGAPRPADFVVHLFEPSRPSQMRGLPFLYPVLNELHDLDDLHILEMRACKDAAEKSNALYNESGEINQDAARRARFQEVQENPGGVVSTVNRAQYVTDTLGGRTVAMKKGEKLEQWRSERPSVATSGYWKYKTDLVCAGVGIPSILVFPESMQGTVYRGALDMADAFFKARFAVISDAARRIYEYVTAYNKIIEKPLQDAPGDWRLVTIHAPRAVNVDVGRVSSAMLAECAAGATNFELIFGPLGLDWMEQMEKKAQQVKFIKDLAARYGVTPGEISNLSGEAILVAAEAEAQQKIADDMIPQPQGANA
jgi:hypothetical protein